MTDVDGWAAALSRLDVAISKAQASDPFSAVTVTVPAAFSRVQLRRELGSRRGVCNVAFRTWGELTSDLGRAALPSPTRLASAAIVDEALRQVLRSGPSPFEPLGRSAGARSELVSLFFELWRAGPRVLGQLAPRGDRVDALLDAMAATEEHLGRHGFVDPGRLLEAAAGADVSHLGAIVRWFPQPLRGLERAVLDHLVGSGVAVTTIEATGTGVALPGATPCGDPDTEVRVAIRSVLTAAEAGIALFRQAIVHPPLERYRRTVHQQLGLARIPRSGPSPLRLEDTATGRALLGLLRLADGRWSRGEVLRWLDCAPVTPEPGEPRPPVSRWDDISARAGVIEGRDQWRTRLERFAAGGSPLDAHAARSRAEADAAMALAAFVDQLADELSERPERWSGWAGWAHRLLDRHLLPDDPAGDWPADEVVSAEAVRAVLSDLGGLDRVSNDCDLATFRHAVERELASRPVRNDADIAAPASEGGSAEPPLPSARDLPGPVGWGVFVGSPAEIRGMGFDRVHVVGMADQFLPGLPPSSSLLPEADVDDPDWPGPARAVEELRDDLAVVVRLADQASATWPLVDPRTGRENTRSRWLDVAGRAPGSAISFATDVNSAQAQAVPLSAADRLLGALAAEDGPLEERAPVRYQPRDPADPAPPLRESVEAAVAGRGLMDRHEGWVGAQSAPLVDGELAPTSLEEYATCPRRYLFHRQLRVTRALRPEAIDEMDPIERGSLTHEVLAAYVDERIRAGSPRSLERLLEIGGERFATAEAEGRCGPPVIAAVERSRLMAELRLFFQDDTLDPLRVELAFGNPWTPEPEEVADPPDEGVPAFALALSDRRVVRFRGRIDRIDRGPESTVVSDYKTGRANDLNALSEDPVARGTKLQLVLYGLVAASLESDRPVRSRYWYTSPGRDHESLLCEIDEQAAQRFEAVVGDIVTGIESGAFPGIPGAETYRQRRPTFEHCAHCDFDAVCPIDRDTRWAGASETEAAAPLNRLTGPPPPEVKDMVHRASLDLLSGSW